eukprot:TRINITY_DN1031_c0_g1_i10.p1 TRINITY_DN1031_c0_g1~~TRINITY_DN1031_c0_g1_i10.p1  ORF type:complete len:140 (+),score=5.56 TRINITY_DN1031_c0_g1_i10:240-659(+)
MKLKRLSHCNVAVCCRGACTSRCNPHGDSAALGEAVMEGVGSGYLLRGSRSSSLTCSAAHRALECQRAGPASSSPSLPTLEFAVSSEAMVRGAGPPAPSSQASERTPRAAQPSLLALCMRTAARWPEQDGADYLPCSHA